MELQDFGQTSLKCETAIKLYCGDKHSKAVDPGCFVDSAQSYGGGELPLRFFCEEEDCFGVGFNFGSSNSRLLCPEQQFHNYNESLSTGELQNGAGAATTASSYPRPFQNQTQLDKLGANQLFNEGSFLKANKQISFYFALD